MITASILVFIAAALNACMDRTTEPVHFNLSIFKNKDKKFWLRSESWQYGKMIFKYRVDFWHLAKSAMIICMVCAMVFYKAWLPYYLDIIVLGAVWNLSFNLFYNRILKRTK